MTTSNDETTPSPDVDATTPLPTTPAPLVGAGQDTTRQMPVSDPLAIFREAPTAQMPTDPFRSDADAAGATRAQGEADSAAQASPHADSVGASRTAFDPASTGETSPVGGDEAPTYGDTRASAGADGYGSTARTQQTWSAPRGPVDVRALPEAPSRGVRVGAFVWAALVCLTGFFLIAEAFIPTFNLPILGITGVAALGIVLILTALFSGRGKNQEHKAQANAGAADSIRQG